MTRAGKILLAGWILVLVGALGLLLGALLYMRLVVGIDVFNQPGTMVPPSQMRALASTDGDADIALQSEVDVSVPFQKENLELPVKGRYRVHLELDTHVPINMTVQFTDIVNVETEVEMDADTQLVSDWLPAFPLRGTIPISIDVPVNMEIPIQTQLRLIHDDEIMMDIDEVLTTSLDDQLESRVTLDQETSAPIDNAFRALILPDTEPVPMVIDQAQFRFPLEALQLFPCRPG